MAATEIVPTSDAGALEADPVQYMAVVLNRAKEWLSEAASIADVRETKAIAVGYESVIREKELAFDAQLSATEIVRRCERRIGDLVRQGQARGEIRKPTHDLGRTDGNRDEMSKPKPSDFFGHDQERTDSYAMAQAPAEEFEQAITDAREEGNLSRANVVRKVKSDREIIADRTAALRGESRKPAAASLDTEKGRINAAAQARRFTDFASALDGYAQGITSLDVALIRAAMEPAELDEWISSLGKSLTKLRRFRTDLQEGRN